MLELEKGTMLQAVDSHARVKNVYLDVTQTVLELSDHFVEHCNGWALLMCYGLLSRVVLRSQELQSVHHRMSELAHSIRNPFASCLPFMAMTRNITAAPSQ